MDPFSITAGTVGITGIAAASFVRLHTIIGGILEAHEEVRDISTNLENIQLPLLALSQVSASQQARDDLNKAGIVEAVNSCGAECAKFSKELQRWTKHSGANKMSFRDRFLVGVWNKEKIRTFRTRLQSCSETLQLALNSTQLAMQLRSEGLSDFNGDKIREGLLAIETELREHLLLATEQQAEAKKRMQQLEADHNGSVEYDQAIEEVAKRVQVLEFDQVSCGVVFAQAESTRSGIDIGKVFTSQKSIAFVGLPPSVVGKLNLRIKEVTTTDGSTSHVGVFGSVNA